MQLCSLLDCVVDAKRATALLRYRPLIENGFVVATFSRDVSRSRASRNEVDPSRLARNLCTALLVCKTALLYGSSWILSDLDHLLDLPYADTFYNRATSCIPNEK
jgi:hypothetical protein